MEYQLSEHAADMMKEREIKENWIKETLESFDIIEKKDDGTSHYIKSISG